MLPPSLTPPTLSLSGGVGESTRSTRAKIVPERRDAREKKHLRGCKREHQSDGERELTNKREPVHAKAPRSMLQFFLSFSPSALSCLYFPLVLPSELFLEGGEPRK